MQKHCKNAIFYEFGCLPTLVPDWIPIGSRLAKSGAQKCKNWCPTGSRRDPDWIHRSARTHSRTYFSLPRPTLAPIFLFRAPAVHQYPPLLHQNGKSSLKPNGGSTRHKYGKFIMSNKFLNNFLGNPRGFRQPTF